MHIKARPRKDAATPKSAGWSLYKPELVAERLNIPIQDADQILEETGFNKAVRIRELVIRWKTRLLSEQKALHEQRQALQRELRQVALREKEVHEMLVEIRNILRIPREKEVQNESPS